MYFVLNYYLFNLVSILSNLFFRFVFMFIDLCILYFFIIISFHSKHKHNGKMARAILIAMALAIVAINVQADIVYYTARLDAHQAGNLYNLPFALGGNGFGGVRIDTTAMTLQCVVYWNKLSGNATLTHIHGDANTAAPFVSSPVMIGLTVDNANKMATCGSSPVPISSAQLSIIQNQQAYFNVHTALNASGEIRGQILPVTNTYVGQFIPSTPMSTFAWGLIQTMWDMNQSRINISRNYIRRLSSSFTGASMNGPVSDPMSDAPVLKTLGFTGTTTEGSVYGQSDMLSAGPIGDFLMGRYYVNVATTSFPNGEIRANLRQSSFGQIEYNSTYQSACQVVSAAAGVYGQVCFDIDGTGMARAYTTEYMDSTCTTKAVATLVQEGLLANRGMHPYTSALDMITHLSTRATAITNQANILQGWNMKCNCGGTSFSLNTARVVDQATCGAGPMACSLLGPDHMGMRRDASNNIIVYNSRADYNLPRSAMFEAVADAYRNWKVDNRDLTFMKQTMMCKNTVALWPTIGIPSSASSLALSFGSFVIAFAMIALSFYSF